MKAPPKNIFFFARSILANKREVDEFRTSLEDCRDMEESLEGLLAAYDGLERLAKDLRKAHEKKYRAIYKAETKDLERYTL